MRRHLYALSSNHWIQELEPQFPLQHRISAKVSALAEFWGKATLEGAGSLQLNRFSANPAFYLKNINSNSVPENVPYHHSSNKLRS